LKISHVIIPRGDHFVSLAAVRSFGKKNIKTKVISEESNALSFFSKYCNSRIFSQKSINLYSEFTENDLIMPIEEWSMIELSKNSKNYPCNLAFPDYAVLEKAFDKKMVLELAQNLSIPCPKTFDVGSADALEKKSGQIPFPAVIKPIRSLGGVGISFVNSLDELKSIYAESVKNFGPVIIQEKIPYDERYSVAILMDFDQSLRRCCVLKVIRSYPMDTGPASFVETVHRPDLVTMSELLLEAIHYYGVAEIEYVIDKRDNTPKLMEINPRFWGSLQGAISAGVDFPVLLFDLFQEGSIEKKLEYKLGVKTRSVFPYEYRRLKNIFRGNYSYNFKFNSLIEFLKFYQDDAYFIFSLNDLQPFFSLFLNSMKRKF
jgi:predicted ATP-grasp superfamily ATP-dependent carboligase